MGRLLCWLAIGTYGLVLALAPARAENPKVSLKLEKATLAEAAAALSQAARIPVELYRRPDVAGARQAEPPAETASFDWTTTTFARALRQLCERFNVSPSRRSGGYTLLPGGLAPVAAGAKPVGLFEKDGIRLSVSSVRVYESRSFNFGRAQGDFSSGNLSLTVAAELADGDGDLVAGIENASAKDDLGNVLMAPPRPPVFLGDSGVGGGRYPDEWSGSLNLPIPHPKAKKLAWLEGDLMAYRSSRPVTIEMEPPAPGKTVRKQVGDVMVVLSGYRMIPKEEPPEADGDPQVGRVLQAELDGGPCVRARLYVPAGTRFAARGGGGYGFPPFAVDASGKKVYGNSWRGSSGSMDGQTMVYTTSWIFPGLEAPPVKLVWELVQRSEPMKLFAVRLTDIPLPGAGEWQAGRPLPNRPPREPAPSHPYSESGGGTVTTRILLQDQVAREGRLQIGLAPKQGGEWGALRWTEVDVRLDGTASLPSVRPGVYRLLRAYRPKEAPAAGPGRWLNGEVEITVQAGKEAEVPPLQWVIGAEKKPAGPAKGRPSPAAKSRPAP